jgi:hypothetical protein
MGAAMLRYTRKHSVYIVFSIILAASLAGCGGRQAAASGIPEESATVSASAAAATPSPNPTPKTTEPPKGTIVDGWIAGIPDYVPRFSYGSIDRRQSSIVEGSISTVFKLCYTGVLREDVDAYAGALRNKGFDVAAAEIGDTYTLIASKDFGWGAATLVITLDGAAGTAVYALEAPV